MARTARAMRAAALAAALLAMWATAVMRVAKPAEGMEGVRDDTVGGALVVSFDPGATDAAGDMEPIEVDAGGTWYVPACCYVREGLVPDRWLAVGVDGACADVAIGARVEGLVAEAAAGDGCDGCDGHVDLSELVERGTLRLVALWCEEETLPTPEEATLPDDACPPDPEAAAPPETTTDSRPDAACDAAEAAPLPEPACSEGAVDLPAESAEPAEPNAPTSTPNCDGGDGSQDALLPMGAMDDVAPVPSEAGTWPVGEEPATVCAAASAESPVLRAASDTDPTSGTAVAVLCTEDHAYPAGTLVITRTVAEVADGAVQSVVDTCGNELVGRCWTGVEQTSSLTVPWERSRTSIRAAVAVEGTRVAPVSMAFWFERCDSLETAELSALDLSGCGDLSYLFMRCPSLTRVDAGDWDLSGTTTLAYAFQDCTALATLDVTGWDVSHVTSLSHTFDGCTSLTALDVSGWDTRRLRTATSAFEGCASVAEIAVGGLTMQSVTNASSMLKGCASLVEVDLSGWSTPRLRKASHLLDGCSSLARVDLSGLDTHGCTTLSQLLRNCASLVSVDVSGIDVSAATDLSGFFEGCASLTELDLSGWDTRLCADLSGLLAGCDALEEADLSGIDTTAATDLAAMLPQGGALRRVTFGPRASLAGAATEGELTARMAPAPATPPHTGRWENLSSGECLTAAEMQALPAGSLAGTWEWEVGFFPLSLGAAGGAWPAGTEPPVWYRKGAVTALPGTVGGTPAPVRSGYALAGWLDEAGQVITEIGADSAGPRALVAVWEVAQVRVRVPVALTLAGVPTPDGVALSLPQCARPVVENLGTTAAAVSASVSPTQAPALSLSVALGEGGPHALADVPEELGVVAGGEALAITQVSGVTDAPAHTSPGVPIGSILWTFSVARGGEGL